VHDRRATPCRLVFSVPSLSAAPMFILWRSIPCAVEIHEGDREGMYQLSLQGAPRLTLPASLQCLRAEFNMSEPTLLCSRLLSVHQPA
jgi:hypothetical protein